MSSVFVETQIGRAQAMNEHAMSSWDDIQAGIFEGTRHGERVSSLFGVESGNSAVELIAVLTNDALGKVRLARSSVSRSADNAAALPSLTPRVRQVHLFEREIAEQFALKLDGHPWLKPLRFAPPFLLHDRGQRESTIGMMDFYRIHGEEVHEVAVGPVHAGVIEPGHFRFQCHGERVFHLEISLGYQYRGIEETLIGGPHKLTLKQVEAAAGDTSIGHAWAYALCVEGLSGLDVSPRAEVIRTIALELERLANHIGDLGSLAGDVGYLPTMSFCGRLRGDFLNMTALICGNRFGRDLVKPGGVRYDICARVRDELLTKLAEAQKDVTGAVELLWDSASVIARFEGVGRVSRALAIELGLVGLAARACGLERDIRFTHPAGLYRYNLLPISLGRNGDVLSRALVRWLEIRRSMQFLREQLEMLTNIDGEACFPVKNLCANAVTVALIEGWRGEICHVAITDDAGRFRRYKICDPSFHNWSGLAMALRGEQISDFPLCNKSFNLSYCGFDL